jgi:hypothetical protein
LSLLVQVWYQITMLLILNDDTNIDKRALKRYFQIATLKKQAEDTAAKIKSGELHVGGEGAPTEGGQAPVPPPKPPLGLKPKPKAPATEGATEEPQVAGTNEPTDAEPAAVVTGGPPPPPPPKLKSGPPPPPPPKMKGKLAPVPAEGTSQEAAAESTEGAAVVSGGPPPPPPMKGGPPPPPPSTRT